MTDEPELKQRVVDVIYRAADDFNAEWEPEARITHSLDSLLFGRGGSLDSLGLVNFIVAVEQRLERELGVSLTLADERALAQETNPFSSIGALADYVCSRVGEGNG